MFVWEGRGGVGESKKVIAKGLIDCECIKLTLLVLLLLL